VRAFELEAAPMKWELQPGLVVDGWGYNGQIPGPELRVREGDLVRVHLRNRLPVPTTIHWHGLDVPLAMDGVPGLSQAPVAPGEEFTYEFVATNPGTRWYHSHVDSNAQLELGLYGALIVEPRAPEPDQFAREVTYLLDEKALDFTPEVALGTSQLPQREFGNGRGGALQYDAFLINGRLGDAIPPLRIASGERLRLRLINAGNLPHAMHLHGQSFSIVATDGNPVPAGQRVVKDTVLIGPGERYDLAIDGTHPGIWMFHCHMPNHQDNGMMTTLLYDGVTPPASAPQALPAGSHPGLPTGLAQALPGGLTQALPASSSQALPAAAHPADGSHHADGSPLENQPPSPAPTAGAHPTATATATTAPAPAPAGGPPSTIRVLDNRFDPPVLSVPVGATVVWANAGLNLHTATALDGGFDTGDVAPGGTVSRTFDQPGTIRYYCRQHLLGGMLGTIQVG
jgi:FtsP/CotA-like multicopper oxidase with cupredoxin domain/plastocyanin